MCLLQKNQKILFMCLLSTFKFKFTFIFNVSVISFSNFLIFSKISIVLTQKQIELLHHNLI